MVIVEPGGGGGGGGGGLETSFKVTTTFCGLFVATLDVMGRLAAYVPGASDPLLAVSVRVAGASVPLIVAVSQPGVPL
jgi:hypothetical protein